MTGARFSRSCRVWLAIVDSPLSASAISEIVDLEPTHALERGKPRPLNPKKPSTFNLWEMLVPIERTLPLQEHLSALMRLIAPRAEAIRRLAQEASVRVHVELAYSYPHGGQPPAVDGIELSRESVESAASIQAEFDIDVQVQELEVDTEAHQ